LAVCRFTDVRPDARYINPRWIVNRRRREEVAPEDPPGDQEIEEEEEDENESVQMDVPEALRLGIDAAIAALPRLSQKNVYLTLHHFAKGICSLGARSTEMAVHTMTRMKELREELFGGNGPAAVAGPAGIAGLGDAPGRPRGRPTKNQIASGAAFRVREKTGGRELEVCPLCADPHNLEDCPWFRHIVKVRELNSHEAGLPGQRRCRVCLQFGHIPKTCPVVAEIRYAIEEEEEAETETESGSG
jgi:hypothetical protein